VAVSKALLSSPIFPALALNETPFDPPGTKTVPGTVTNDVLLLSATVNPPDGAGCDNPT